ncbi:hypothetical protein ACH5RR_010864 [Cinchona calisaya]|uniref:Uncharacterized protein n=1 Tax=Cinchona calisaya TaxID=153742 RepID=A0ABD3AK36_9GENT
MNFVNAWKTLIFCNNILEFMNFVAALQLALCHYQNELLTLISGINRRLLVLLYILYVSYADFCAPPAMPKLPLLVISEPAIVPPEHRGKTFRHFMPQGLLSHLNSVHL